MEGTCPQNWDIPPSRVGVGDTPAVNKQTASRTKFTISLSSKSSPTRANPDVCNHRGGVSECEQWSACAVAQDERGEPPLSWYAAYPGTSCGMGSLSDNDCQTEKASRLCSAKEKAEDIASGVCSGDCNSCRRPNAWSLTDIVGTGGGPEGKRTICALPPGASLSAASCRTWTFTLRGADLQ